MFGNVTALEGLHVAGKYRGISMQHTCSMHAAWDPRTVCGLALLHFSKGLNVRAWSSGFEGWS
jgi:hypothetical protein